MTTIEICQEAAEQYERARRWICREAEEAIRWLEAGGKRLTLEKVNKNPEKMEPPEPWPAPTARASRWNNP